MNQSIKSVLSLWMSEAISSEDVISWADRHIAASEEPIDALLELSLKGSKAYLKIPSSKVPHPQSLSYLDEFSIRASKLDLEDSADIERFVEWVVEACIGEDLAEREVRFSYDLYFLYVEGDDIEGAKLYVRDALPVLLENCQARATPFWTACARPTVAADRPKY